MEIRRTQVKDAEAFRALWLAVSEEGNDYISAPPSIDKVIRVLEKHVEQAVPCFVAVDEDKIVASAEVFPCRDFPVEKHGLLGIQVHGDHRRRGIATQLMQTVLAESQRYGIELVELHVYQHNEAAVALYQSAGFVMMPESSEDTLPSGRKVINRRMVLTI